MMKWKKSDRIALVVSLVLAVILWSYVMNQENPQITREYRNIPVRIVNIEDLIPKELMLLEPTKPQVTVTLSGLRNTLNLISPNQIVAEVDLKGYDEGALRIPVTIKQPAGTSVVAVSDRDILFTIEKIVERSIKIKPHYNDETLAEDFKYSFSVDPQMVSFQAPRTLANRVHSAEVDVDLSGKTDSFTTNQKIKLLDSDGVPVLGITPQEEIAVASVEVKRVKEVPIVIAHSGTLPEGVTVLQEKLEPNTIRVQGADELVKELKNVRTAPIDYAEMTESGQRTVQLQLPEGIAEDESLTIVYTYTLRTPIEQSFVVGRSAIEIKNLENGLEGKLADGNSIMIQLTGDEAALEALTEKALQLYVNADNLAAGTHTVPIQMENITGISIKDGALPNIEITISESATTSPGTE